MLGKIKTVFLITTILLGFIFIVATGGGSSGGGGNYSIEITKFDWIIENIDPSFWSDPPGTATCFYNFWISYEGDNIGVNAIESARVYLPSGIPCVLSADQLNPVSKYISGGRYMWNGDLGNSLPIGTLTAEIILANGNTTTYNQTIPVPGSKTSNGFSYVYTEDYVTSDSDYTPMLKRATIESCKKGGGTIRIEFSVSDSNVYNGYVNFYNSEGYFIAQTKALFRNTDTGVLSDIINSGTGFHTNGSVNLLEITNGDISFETGYEYADILKVMVVLRDGAQYGTRVPDYHCMSRSFKTDFSNL